MHMLGEITQYIALAVLLAGLAYFLTLIAGNIKVQNSANISAFDAKSSITFFGATSFCFAKEATFFKLFITCS